MHWLTYSIISTVLLGISMSLYKLPAFRSYSSFISTVWTNAFSAALAVLGLVVFSHEHITTLSVVSWYAIAWGMLFAITMMLQKILLHDVETNSVYPVTSSIGSVVTILIGLVLLSEHVSLLQTVGIVIMLLSVFLYTRKGGSFPLNQKTTLLSTGIILSSAVSKYLLKIAAGHESVSHFMTWQYIGATIFALVVACTFERGSLREVIKIQKYWKGSALIALFSVLGGYAIFMALSIGPLSGVYAVHPAYTIIAGLFGALFFREKLTSRKVLLAALSVAGIILLKIGG